MKKICIVGMGYVCLTLAMHAARNGYEVYGIEILDSTFEKISSGKTHFHEPGLEELLQHSLNKSFFISKHIPEELTFDYFVVTVGTPLAKTGLKIPNMSVLDNSIKSIAPHVTSESLVILRSTIPVGSSRMTERHICKINGLNSINISFCPERTAEGSALTELRALPQVISGNTNKAILKAKAFFEPLVDEIVCASSLEEAELTKLFNNTYRDAIFAIANTFNKIAQSFNVDGMAAINNANYNYPRSSIPKPGFVAGPCLEKDAYILSSEMKDGDLKDFILGIRKANENLEQLTANKIKQLFKTNPTARCLVTGLAFKGVPQTNDLRGSSSIKILDRLKDYHSQILIHDFMNSKKELEELCGFESINSNDIFDNDLENFNFIGVLNNHPMYKSTKMKSFIQKQCQSGASIIDAWGVLELKDQFTLYNLFIENEL